MVHLAPTGALLALTLAACTAPGGDQELDAAVTVLESQVNHCNVVSTTCTEATYRCLDLAPNGTVSANGNSPMHVDGNGALEWTEELPYSNYPNRLLICGPDDPVTGIDGGTNCFDEAPLAIVPTSCKSTASATGLPVAIPDNNPNGITRSLGISAPGWDSVGIVNLVIKHTFKGDLAVRLQPPSGPEVVLHNHSGGSADDVTLRKAIRVDERNGTWQLKVADTVAADVGTLQQFSLETLATCRDDVRCTPDLRFCAGKAASSSQAIDLAIPDNNAAGVTINLSLKDLNGELMGDNMIVGDGDLHLKIQHPNRGDLEASVICPNGMVVPVLQPVAGDTADNIDAFFPVTGCAGTPGKGTWKLVVKDRAAGNVGKIKNWSVDVDPGCH
jgi:subtilisin-like proprotein convertase family protein